MANRNTLHIKKLDAFKDFLGSEGVAYRPGKGVWQVLQVLTIKHGWQCIFSRADMPEHYTIQDKLYPLVRQFLNNQKDSADCELDHEEMKEGGRLNYCYECGTKL